MKVIKLSSNTVIEATSPIYLHPIESSNSVAVEKLEVKRDVTDLVKQDAWDTCNNMVISWIHANVSTAINKSVMFVSNASNIWKHLEQRYTIANGSRKRSISEYYTVLRDLWEEIEYLSDYPPVTNVTNEINAFLKAFHSQ
ncbi:putative nudix hydrolase C6G9.05 [Bienertia sinuspersici]